MSLVTSCWLIDNLPCFWPSCTLLLFCWIHCQLLSLDRLRGILFAPVCYVTDDLVYCVAAQHSWALCCVDNCVDNLLFQINEVTCAPHWAVLSAMLLTITINAALAFNLVFLFVTARIASKLWLCFEVMSDLFILFL